MEAGSSAVFGDECVPPSRGHYVLLPFFFYHKEPSPTASAIRVAAVVCRCVCLYGPPPLCPHGPCGRVGVHLRGPRHPLG